MGDDSKLSWKIKWQISRFAGRLSEKLSKTQRRFVSEMLYGIQAAKDVKVSNIARALNEPIALIKTENRLCRNLTGEDLTDHVNRWLCWRAAPQVTDDMVLAVDLSDLSKPYAKKMEHLAGVRDGSTGEIAKGYWLCEVVAADPYGDRVVPLYGELYSQEAEEFVSENEQVLKAIGTVSQATQKRGIVAIDRGGDRPAILNYLIDNELDFVVRVNRDRPLRLPGGKTHPAGRAVRWCRTPIKRTVTVEREGYEHQRQLQLGSMPVRLPGRPKEQLWLVVIRGFGEEPILLLTRLPPEADCEHAIWIADVYLTRWKCEQTHRFQKQSYQLEDVRVRGYVALRNIYVLVHAVMYFVSVVIGAKARMNLIFKRVCEKAKRFYEIATFFQYAVADGIHRLLFGSHTGANPPPPPRDTGQLLLDFARPPT